MHKKSDEEQQIYIIPPNFIDNGSFFGGMFKARNAIEALVLLGLITVPTLYLDIGLTAKIIILCLTALPISLFAIIGINGESLTAFALIYIRYLKNRRIISEQEIKKTIKTTKPLKEDFPAEFDELDKYLARQKRKKAGKETIQKLRDKIRTANNISQQADYLNPVAEYLPISKIENGIIHTKDNRYIKIIEIVPINFLLRSAREQRNIIYAFISYLKISPIKVQFKVLTKKADINRHLDTVKAELAKETEPGCLMLGEDYLQLVAKIGSKEAITRRFFLIFEYEPYLNSRKANDPQEAYTSLQTATLTAQNYLKQCGNEIIKPENEDQFIADILYNLLCRSESVVKPISAKAAEINAQYLTAGKEAIPVAEFFAPQSIDFSNGKHIKIDDIYYSYLLIPGDGYKPQVPAGWLSLIVNAGEGIDLDMFLSREPKEKIVQKLGQRLRINRSKIKETSDTNSDFDDLDDAIRSGYFLKNGLANNEDFYYLNILITITATSLEELEWRQAEMKKLLLSQDMQLCTCSFREEHAFLSSLPLVQPEKGLFERSKRNVLTLGAAACYPFTSYEMCDDNGILLGVNQHNNSLIIVDIFNSQTYKNANMAILGTSGAGKTFTLQLMALRMRRKGIQVFILAPLKGHELHRACNNIGGEFVQISPASKNCINIMEIRKADKSVSELLDGPSIEKSELAAKIQKLHIFFSLLIPDMSFEEKQLLDDALIKTYAAKGINHDNQSLLIDAKGKDYKQMPILGDLYAILINSSETKRLANILNRLVNGSASTFNQQTNVSLDNKYIVLDISELTGDLLTIGMFVALDFVWDKAKENRTAEKAIFIDETWQLIGGSSNRLAADFVLEIFKIIRGYGGSAVCASQDLNDFFALDDGKYGKGIINNSKTKIILNLEDDEARRVKQFMNLSETEVMAITHFERGSGLISTNNNNVTVEFKCSQLEKDLITTDRRELQDLIIRQREGEVNAY